MTVKRRGSETRDRTGRATGLCASVVLVVVLGSVAALPASAVAPRCFGREATIVGTNGDDVLAGTRGADVIVAGRGADVIEAGEGRDLICAGGGADGVFAGPGNDRVAGGPGFDTIFPGPGDDLVDGGPHPLDLVTSEGVDVPVFADLGRGMLFAQGRDALRRVEAVAGGEGDDVLIGTDGDNDLFGYGGDDILIGRGGPDLISAGAGDDLLRGGGGDDFLELVFVSTGPGLDDDVVATDGVTVDLGSGTASGPETGNDVFTGIESASGTLGDDVLIGDDGFNNLVGLEGDDTIVLGPGEPNPLGVANLAQPGPGDDTVTGGPDFDAVDYSFSGLFEPFGPVEVNLSALTATGAGLGVDALSSIEAAGGTVFDDVLLGDAGDNLLVGYEGSDSVSGGAGDDLLDGDTFVLGVPFDLDGNDDLVGGTGTDTCLGGETTSECEILELPRRDSLSGRDGNRLHAVARRSSFQAHLHSNPVRATLGRPLDRLTAAGSSPALRPRRT